MDRIYLVTGAAGHLGSVVTRQLIEKGETVRTLVLPGEKYIPQEAQTFYGDVRNKDSLKQCFEGIEGRKLIVIHCAGIVSIASKIDPVVYEVNVTGTKNIVELCIEHHAERLVYVSSVHAIPEESHGSVISETKDFNPDKVEGGYAKSKAEATAYVLQAAKQGLNACVVHPSGIIGPYDYGRGHLTMLIIDYCKHRLTAGVDGGYDFVDVRDVASGIIAACDKGVAGECYILSNKYFKVKEILSFLHEITKGNEIKTFLPSWFVKITAPFAELYYKILNRPPLFTSYSIYTLNSNAFFSNKKAAIELGYATRDIRETISDTIDWLKAQGRI